MAEYPYIKVEVKDEASAPLQRMANIIANWLFTDEVWVAHIVETEGKCNCEYDVEMGNFYCDEWKSKGDELFLKFHGITRKEFEANQRREFEAKMKAENATAHKTVAELAAEQGIDPRLLP